MRRNKKTITQTSAENDCDNPLKYFEVQYKRPEQSGLQIVDTLKYLKCKLSYDHSSNPGRELHIFQQRTGIQRRYWETEYEEH